MKALKRQALAMQARAGTSAGPWSLAPDRDAGRVAGGGLPRL
jgi:hypothetical protein